LVEADESLTRMLRVSLAASGLDVTQATCGDEALRALERGATDAVILDLGLPDGLAGAVLHRLRQMGREGAPIWVVISALDYQETTRRYGPVGDHFLAMPFDPWELIRMLEKLLEARRERNDASSADTPERRTP
jgi:DNA-binding response OmpR family regulator